MFIEGRGASRRVETLLEVDGLDADGDYVAEAARAPTLHHRLIGGPSMTMHRLALRDRSSALAALVAARRRC